MHQFIPISDSITNTKPSILSMEIPQPNNGNEDDDYLALSLSLTCSSTSPKIKTPRKETHDSSTTAAVHRDETEELDLTLGGSKNFDDLVKPQSIVNSSDSGFGGDDSFLGQLSLSPPLSLSGQERKIPSLVSAHLDPETQTSVISSFNRNLDLQLILGHISSSNTTTSSREKRIKVGNLVDNLHNPAHDLELRLCYWYDTATSCEKRAEVCYDVAEDQDENIRPPIPPLPIVVNGLMNVAADEWEIEKVVKASDVGGQARLLMNKKLAEQYVYPKLIESNCLGMIESEQGLRVLVVDKDSNTNHMLTFKRWYKSCRSFVFINGWSTGFVKRRELKIGNKIGLTCYNSDDDHGKIYFKFSVLSRKSGGGSQ